MDVEFLQDSKAIDIVNDKEIENVIENKSRSLKSLSKRLSYRESDRLERLESLANMTKSDLSFFSSMRLSSTHLRGNIESLIGSIEIPVGVAGPLLIHGGTGDYEVFAPLATSEGALVSSVNRGALALKLSGGVTARVLSSQMVRAPMFDCGSIEHCIDLLKWIEQRRAKIQGLVRKYSNHAILKDLEFQIISPCLHVRFVYETGDASGQNMVTLCTWNVCRWILQEYKNETSREVRQFIIDGNLSTDKKVSALSAISGRGREVVAEVLIPHSVVRRVLKSEAQDMAAYFRKAMSTQVVTGTIGLNVNVANVIAAIFASTGQDLACIHESSIGQVYFEERAEGLYVSLLLPSLVIGTVGGGVSMEGQSQFLQMLGAYGPGGATRFAEIVASFCLALEISTGAALTSGQFVEAHERLGRNKQTYWLKPENFDLQFFNSLDGKETCKRFFPISGAAISDSFVSELVSHVSGRPCGLWPFQLEIENNRKSQVLVKLKASDDDLLLALEILASLRSPGLGELLKENRDQSLFLNSSRREVLLAQHASGALQQVMPQIYKTCIDENKKIYYLVQEFLQDVRMLNSLELRCSWQHEDIEKVLEGISRIHGQFLNRYQEIKQICFLSDVADFSVGKVKEAYLELSRQLHLANADWMTKDDYQFLRDEMVYFESEFHKMHHMPKTLIHNDFNPRNVAIRNQDHSLVAFDWELASVHLPQRDLVEFLAFTMQVNTDPVWVVKTLEQQRLQLEFQSHVSLPDWWKGSELALLDFLLFRLPIYVVPQTVRAIPFLEPVFRSAQNLLQIIRKKNDSLS